MTEPEPADGTTGHPAVDAALSGLADVAELPPEDQIEAYEAVHRTLQDTLQNIEQG